MAWAPASRNCPRTASPSPSTVSLRFSGRPNYQLALLQREQLLQQDRVGAGRAAAQQGHVVLVVAHMDDLGRGVQGAVGPPTGPSGQHFPPDLIGQFEVHLPEQQAGVSGIVKGVSAAPDIPPSPSVLDCVGLKFLPLEGFGVIAGSVGGGDVFCGVGLDAAVRPR